MIAEVELTRPEGAFVGPLTLLELGEPRCGEDFCDGCGDCLNCQGHGPEDWCQGGSRWVVYQETLADDAKLRGRVHGALWSKAATNQSTEAK